MRDDLITFFVVDDRCLVVALEVGRVGVKVDVEELWEGLFLKLVDGVHFEPARGGWNERFPVLEEPVLESRTGCVL